MGSSFKFKQIELHYVKEKEGSPLQASVAQKVKKVVQQSEGYWFDSQLHVIYHLIMYHHLQTLSYGG